MIHRKIDDAIAVHGLPKWYRIRTSSSEVMIVRVTAVLENGLEWTDEKGRRGYIFASGITSIQEMDDVQTVHITVEPKEAPCKKKGGK